ncbi:MAG: phosphatase PAP2 family protein [Limisphaerales bacterium]
MGSTRTIRAVHGIQAWDEVVFRWFNQHAAAPWLDPLARGLSGHPAFVPVLVAVGLGLLWRGGPRGLVFVLGLGITIGLANEFLAEPIKDWVGRSRPYAALPDAVLRVGKGNPLGSMPSAHAMNMAVIATWTCWYYPRVGVGVAVLALGVGWSRIYNGVHFPADVLAGFGLGTGFALLVVASAERIWRDGVLPRRPSWKERLPSLARPPTRWKAKDSPVLESE